MTIKKVLVTGSKGFVGRHLSKRLKEVGFQVVTTANNRKLIDVTNVDQIPTIENVNAIVHLVQRPLFQIRLENRIKLTLLMFRYEGRYHKGFKGI